MLLVVVAAHLLQVQHTRKKSCTLMFVHSATLFTLVNRKSLILLARLISSTVASVKNRFFNLAENSLVKFHRIKKALIISAFFIACVFTTNTYSQSSLSCSRFTATETASIAYVHDGDTIHLDDKRKVRLIGIDTPELAHRRKKHNYPVQAYALEARDFARQLIQQYGNKVGLMLGIEPADHYGRQLFHIQLSDGSLLQTRLLQAGLAIAYTTPPNQQLSLCYQAAESIAQEKSLNIWTNKKYHRLDANKLSSKHQGFHIIGGKVRHIGESKKAFWINFYGNFSARINKRDLKYFPFALRTLLEKEITVRGWIRHYKNKPQMSLRHASAIQIIEP